MEVKPGYKQTEVGTIPEDWEVVLLDSVAKRGSGHTPDKAHPEYWGGDIKWISLQDTARLDRLYIDDTAVKITPAGIANSSAQVHPKGNVVLSRDAGVGKSAIMNCDMAVSQHFMAWTCGTRLANKFLYYWLQSAKPEFERIAMGNTIKTIGLPYFRQLVFPLPPKAEQDAIAGALSDADSLIESLEQLVVKKRQIKQGAMQELLTGQKRLPDFSGQWHSRQIGEIIFECSSGATPYRGRPDFYKGHVKWITSGELNYNVIYDTLEHISDEARRITNLKLHPPGTFLMAITGLEAAGTRGACGIVGMPATTNQSCMALYPTPELDSLFLYHWYVLNGNALALRYCQGTKQQSYTARLVKLLPVLLPPTVGEQSAIATILSDMDAEVAALEAKLAKARQVKQGMMQELLTGKVRLMSTVGAPERETQNRIIALFRDELGYRYLGDWSDRAGNSNIEEMLLTDWLKKRGVTAPQISIALHKLRTEADNHNRSLYGNNQAVYNLLRYGVPVKTDAGKVTETVHLIDWDHQEKNDFAIAEEVTLKGGHERRPDIVLYVNGIAIGVLELKNSRVSIGDGIRQNLSNQQPEFNAWFFSTVQFIFAGNDSQGLQYGTIGTPEKYFLKWKEDEADNSRFKLDKYLLKICAKHRLIELMHDFVLFDAGVKKLPRVHQYFGIKAAQEFVKQKKGGIIWHTQGSGKSIVMVLLAKWILENNPNARVAIMTDRDELDKQIEGVFSGAGEAIHRTSSGRDLMAQLGQAKPRLLCSLVHKFGRKDVDDFDAFIKELESQPSPTVGEVFVFVDECHRTQSGKLHRVMKAMMPNAIFVGFTGTPLLKKDKATSLEVFGGYIHTYKFSEAVEDEVVLDLVYEARDIDQKLGSQAKIDAWFEAKTKGLNDWQKEELKSKWGTMQQVLSSKSRMDRVVADIVFDFSVKPRLSSERGNAILIASSIYEACKYFTLFQKTPFKGKCAVVTSYNPQAQDVTKEEVGANTETDKQLIYNTYLELLKDVEPGPGQTKTEAYEERAKTLFVKEPANMKLLVVVDKLLTGFDAPPCTYLYIDKSMQDHGLFQAICRTNRLDGEDKEFGYIVDYKDLFKKVEKAIAVYTSELDHSAGGADPEVLLQDRLTKGKERLDNAIEALALLCEPVENPKGELEHIHYFCGNTEVPTDLQEREPQRAQLYKGVVGLVRAYANIADELDAAGYSDAQIAAIKQQLDRYLKVREVVRMASGETLDLKAYEADMRHLIDTYIEADEPRKISPFDGMGLLDLIVKTGIADAIAKNLGGLKGNKNAIAETIENNVRSKIIKEHLNDPAFYANMSKLLDEIIAARKAKAIEYEEYLKRIAELAKKVDAGKAEDTPAKLDTPGKRALYNNLAQNEGLALKIDDTVRKVRPDGWRGVQAREQLIKAALYGVLQDKAEVERIFLLVKAQAEY